MSHYESREALHTFNDVAACIAEEEWKLLKEWQKELYRNVMKAIQQAVVSLGPVIATTIFSLSATENQDLLCQNHKNSEAGHRIDQSVAGATAGSRAVFEVNHEEHEYYMDPRDTDRRGSSDCLNTAAVSACSGVAFEVNAEVRQYYTDPPDNDRRDASDCFNTGSDVTQIISFPVKEEGDTYMMDHQGSESGASIDSHTGMPSFSNNLKKTDKHRINIGGRECSPELNSDGASITLLIKDEDALPIAYPGSKIKRVIGHRRGDGTTNTRENNRNSLKRTEKSTHYDFSSKETATTALQNSSGGTNTLLQNPVPGTNYGLPGWSESTPERVQTHVPQITNFQRERNPVAKQYVCNVCSKTFSRRRNVLRHQKAHAGVRYDCNQCEKSFSQKGDLTVHQRIHAGRNPYTCTYCDKGFSSKSNLNQHKRKHTGMYAGQFYTMA